MRNKSNIGQEYNDLVPKSKQPSDLSSKTDSKSFGPDFGMATKRPKVFLRTFGCQMNSADSEVAMGIIKASHLNAEFTGDKDTADVVLINTCSVRDHAEQRVFGMLRRLGYEKRERAGLIIGVMGCMAVEYKEKLFRKFPQIDFICGAKDMDTLPELIENAVKRVHQARVTEEGYGVHEGNLAFRGDKIRAFVPITHGCDNFCSYCIVPYVRGREISRPYQEILEELEYLAERGYKQIMFLGQNVNSYGVGLKDKITFPELLRRAAEIKGIELLEYMTSHPKDVSDELIDTMASVPQISKHIHLPLQSGSNAVLARMNRGYSREEYLEIVAKLRKSVLDVSITTDIIIGFPDETESDFHDTVHVMKTVSFDASFIFKYSPREETKAFSYPDNVPKKEKERRNLSLLALQDELTETVNVRYVGRTMQALVVQESKKRSDELLAVTWNDKLVVVPREGITLGDIVNVQLLQQSNNTFKGKVVDHA
jgi:tRNA-2-methylthio-N6-dimethylallyladenosine synthase